MGTVIFLCLNIVLVLATGLANTLAFAADGASPLKTQLISGCYLDELERDVLMIGKTIDRKEPIASVSKVFTTLMMVNKFDIEKSRFNTKVYVKNLGPKQFHVHIRGSQDPYFNRFKMHRIISELNKKNISDVALLTFDENVKFLYETDSNQGFKVCNKTLIKPITLKADINFPDEATVRCQLQTYWTILKDYNRSFAQAKKQGVEMVSNPRFTTKKVQFESSQQFEDKGWVYSFDVGSEKVETNLKKMNWNSNNFAANRMYVTAGGQREFERLFYGDLKLSENEVSFVNGSGQNHALQGEGRLYNESTCSVAVRTLRYLNKRLSSQKKQLTDVMSVVGLDIGSTVGGKTYTTEVTRGKVVAKTGTVGTNVTLAGAINTKNGLRYFMFNVELAHHTHEVRGRKIVLAQLEQLILKTRSAVAFDYKSVPNDDFGLEEYDEESQDSEKSELDPSDSLSNIPTESTIAQATAE